MLEDAPGSRDDDALWEAIARRERIAAEVGRIEGDLRTPVAVQDARGWDGSPRPWTPPEGRLDTVLNDTAFGPVSNPLRNRDAGVRFPRWDEECLVVLR